MTWSKPGAWWLMNRYIYIYNICIKDSADRESVVLGYHIYPTSPLGQDMTQGQFFKRSLTGLNLEFSFS